MQVDSLIILVPWLLLPSVLSLIAYRDIQSKTKGEHSRGSFALVCHALWMWALVLVGVTGVGPRASSEQDLAGLFVLLALSAAGTVFGCFGLREKSKWRAIVAILIGVPMVGLCLLLSILGPGLPD